MLRSLLKGLLGRISHSARSGPGPAARAADTQGGDAEALYALGVLEGQAGNYAAAARHLNRLLAVQPGHVEAWNALGNVNKLERKWERAAACYRQAVELDPRLASALSNLGTCVRNQGRAAEAMDYLARAAALEPSNTEIQFNVCLGMMDAGRMEEGERGLLHVLDRQPQNAEAHAALGYRLLATGRFSEGWREYEWRTQTEGWERRNAEAAYPWWNGEALAGRRLLVRAEQGLGDQIMFASCLPELLAMDGRFVVECDPRLERIFARSFPAAAIRPQPQPGRAATSAGPEPDLQVNLGSLPFLLRRGEGAFPSHQGYLRPDPEQVKAWHGRLAALGPGMKVGVSWRGGTWNTRQFARSLALKELAPLFRRVPARYVSVQYGDCGAEIEELKRDAGVEVHHWQEAIDDYDQTAALVAALDSVISVQTAVVHLGGALGKPVSVMVPAVPEWRYLVAGDSLPWYPSVRILRQPRPEDWRSVIEDAARGLHGLARG